MEGFIKENGKKEFNMVLEDGKTKKVSGDKAHGKRVKELIDKV
jgi:hypothetical protein